MANRLTKIATRTGDDGTTGLGDGSRTRKNSPRIAAIGSIDELNSTLGLLAAEDLPAAVRPVLAAIQHDLFDLGGELSIPGLREDQPDARFACSTSGWTDSTATCRRWRSSSCPAARGRRRLRMSRATICRRAERDVVALAGLEFVRPLCQQYLNRLSDLLFVLARVLNRASGGQDVLWEKDRPDR